MLSQVPKINQRRLVREAHWRWPNVCPCCGNGMTAGSYVEGQVVPRNTSTKGHNLPRGHNRYHWIHICRGCNAEQADRTFREWSYVLFEAGRKEQAQRVRVVAQLFADYTGT